MKKVIAVDFDDVIAGFNQAYITHHNATYGTALTLTDITTYDLCAVYQSSYDVVVERVRHFCHGHHATIRPIAGVGQALATLSQQYELHVVTSRCESLHDITTQWLEDNGITHLRAIHFTNAFGFIQAPKRTKLEVCQAISATMLIDDAPEHCLSVAKAGLPVILMDQPWNQPVAHPNISRVQSWDEAIGLVHKNTP